ncbi:MAG: PAS domain-containing protein [Planctomycetota bacterium]|nr:PAS domain-containing protein [Planctomycetota bacterium]
MPTALRSYGLASVVVIVTAFVRFLLIPVLGNRFGFDLFLISTFICSRYFGFGPSVFSLLAGALPVTIFYFIGPDLYDPYFLIGLIAYLILGAIVVLVGKSEQDARSALQSEIQDRKAAEKAVRSSEAQLRQQEERLRLAVKSANIGTWDFNPVTGEQELSSRTKAMLGFSPDASASDLSFRDRIHPEDLERVNQAIQEAFDPTGDGKYEIDCRLVWPDNTTHWFIAKGQAMFEGEEPNRRAVRFIGAVLDVTERRQAEEKLRASENRFQAMMDNTSAVIYLKDTQGRYLVINRRYEELFNVTQHHVVGKTDADIFPSDVVAKLQANDQQVMDTGKPLEFEEVVPHSDGPHTYVSVKFPILDPTGQCIAVGGISTDISDRKRAAEAIAEEQELLRHTIEVQDHERQLIAYAIHDGIVQYAAGALMQLEGTRSQEKSDALAEQIEHIVGILRKTVDEGRRLMNGIRTPVLDDWGVVAAVEHLIQEEDRAHVHVEFIKDDRLERMEPQIEEAIYRIVQEALTNIAKHSQSENVQVELGLRGDGVHLEVRDWGVGFTPATKSKGTHGLKGMTERARIAGGTCTINSTLGEGTRIVVDLPYLRRS